MTVVSLTLPDELLERFDEFIKSRGYYSRSEAFRDAIRNLISEWEFSRRELNNVAATIMITSNYRDDEVDSRIGEIRHKFDDIVVENIHRHVGQRYCLEILLAEGEYKRVQDLIGRIRGVRGIHQIRTVFLPL
ncbi:nickel-responsive transcriptional regulator NikR [Candidatus Bathyarchaeota archaeon]|nr:nickel-responsive transcriptional regulator NikR [Candidatus Bathyarchaeota archaeon]